MRLKIKLLNEITLKDIHKLCTYFLLQAVLSLAVFGDIDIMLLFLYHSFDFIPFLCFVCIIALFMLLLTKSLMMGASINAAYFSF